MTTDDKKSYKKTKSTGFGRCIGETCRLTYRLSLL